MSQFLLVLNPNAGKGAGRKLRGRILQNVRSRTADFEIVETTGPGDATAIARNASSPIVVAVGGDGTAHEVANGLIGSNRTLGVLPIGSGNDFVKSIGIPADLTQAVSALMSAKTAMIDVGQAVVEPDGTDGPRGRSAAQYFVNGVGMGFDAAVAVRTNRISFFSGTLVYVVAVFQTLGRYVAPEFTVQVDQRIITSRNLLMAIGNGRCAGGGFFLTPDASVTDGNLDLCIVEDMPTMAILRLMPRVMKGKHHNVRGVRFDRGKSITVQVTHPVAVHADGEILGERVSKLDVRVLARALKTVVGPGFGLSK